MAEVSMRRLVGGSVCSRCIARTVRPQPLPANNLYRSSFHTKRKLHDSLATRRNAVITQNGFVQDYFSANPSMNKEWLREGLRSFVKQASESPNTTSSITAAGREASIHSSALPAESRHSSAAATSTSLPPTESLDNPPLSTEEGQQQELLPHRRRKRRKEEDAQDTSESLPLDASSQLTTAATTLPTSATLRRRFATYLALTKPRLSFLILLTTTSAYSLYPLPEIISSSTAALQTTLSTSTLTLLFLTSGTFLSCAAANTLNMLFEPKYDALMTRTRNRPLVRQLISHAPPPSSPPPAPPPASLSSLNIFLYAGVYTPMKRLSPANTWVGAIVGGIPPLMGWCAAAGQAATTEHHSATDLLLSESATGGWLLAALLFAWQFPHFMSLSHTIREDYRAAGHKMLAWTNPARNARVALRYSLAMFPICAGMYAIGLVNQGFLVISTACNLWMTKEAVAFWRKQGGGGSARGLFWASVWQLPLVLVGALVCKKGIWDGVFGEGEQKSVYEPQPAGDVEVVAETAEEKVVVLAGETLGLEERNRRWNMSMLGFKRPS
ncbi:Protoheme IX farnesyltransferase, mitochondrial [Cyphellophora attinorum]|uniref:Heme O synthase n=1 Tax=Cyphellophora attinorum TaxID=1664694 RepID=A0A0N1NZZ5_9EURO|nr:Protoheme IX farnesyltransferase, mitochondrial [Phialophora attinorum]KPI39554.1 Protoheme IX farnesyltransferase, mitochondrial [Phialophora attinorum]